ncbi:hypothetical protein T4B_5454, partial [Trichinella pseudospiralis]
LTYSVSLFQIENVLYVHTHFSRILPSFPDAPAKYWSVEWRRVAGLQLTANLFRSSRNLPN